MLGSYADDYYFEPSTQRLVLKGQLDDNTPLPFDLQGSLTDTKYRGNSYAAWRQVTPQHNKLIDAMLSSSAHIIATMRSKTDWEAGKSFALL